MHFVRREGSKNFTRLFWGLCGDGSVPSFPNNKELTMVSVGLPKDFHYYQNPSAVLLSEICGYVAQFGNVDS